MNEIIDLVTPNTRAILWMPGTSLNAGSAAYAQVDYLLDGLLTSTRKNGAPATSQLLVGSNFGSPLHVFLVHSVTPAEIQGFVTLVSKELTGEARVLVIDEAGLLPEVQKHIPKDLQPKLHKL